MSIIREAIDIFTGKAPEGARRSKEWAKVRKAHLQLYPACACCGGTKKCEVHHIIPFHVCQELELMAHNLLTLCEAKKCHLAMGHLYSYKSYNKEVLQDLEYWKTKISKRP
jgi:5-methylcytosine-specific restriction endonuclease McrA